MHYFVLENNDKCMLRSGQTLPADLKGTTTLSIPSHLYVPGFHNQHVFISGTYGIWKQNLAHLQGESTRDRENVCRSVMTCISDFLPEMERVYETKDSDTVSTVKWQNFMEDCSILICHEKMKRGRIIVMPELDFEQESNAYFWW